MLRPKVWVSVSSLLVFAVIVVIGGWQLRRSSRHNHKDFFGPNSTPTSGPRNITGVGQGLPAESPHAGPNDESSRATARKHYKLAFDSLARIVIEPGKGESQIYHLNKLPTTPELEALMSDLATLANGDYELLVKELFSDISSKPNEQVNAKFILAYRMLELANQRGVTLAEIQLTGLSLLNSHEPSACLFASIIGTFYGTPAIASALQDSLAHLSEGWQRDYAQIQIIKALGRCGNAQSLDALLQFSREDTSKRWYVANAIMDLADPEQGVQAILAIVKQSNDAGFIPLERIVRTLAKSAVGTTYLLQCAREEANVAARRLLLEAWCIADADPRSPGPGSHRPFLEGVFTSESDSDVRLFAFKALAASGTPVQRIEVVVQARGKVPHDAWAQRLIELMPLSVKNGLASTLAEGLANADRHQIDSIVTQLGNYTLERRCVQTDPEYEVLRRALLTAIQSDAQLTTKWSQLR